MKILKFGGTSIGSAGRLNAVADIVNDGHRKIVVLSAMAGGTDSLIQVVDFHKKGMHNRSKLIASKLENKHKITIHKAIKNIRIQQKGLEIVTDIFDTIYRVLSEDPFNNFEKIILAQGELLSTNIFKLLLEDKGVDSVLIPALEFMRTDANGEADGYYIKQNLWSALDKYPSEQLFITQGYICRDFQGEISNLQRGGSDYTASLVGAAVSASEVQIWTDIDGFHNNDPRYVDATEPIRHLSFEEAAELAYFGAKILHPTSIIPCKRKNIPVRLKNSLNPNDKGTLITKQTEQKEIKAIAAKDEIVAIKVNSGRMLMAYGFLKKVFEVFEKYKTPIDVVTTSEVAVSITIDNATFVDCIIDELRAFGTVEVEKKQCIICVVGDLVAEKYGLVNKILESINHIPIRMISYGGSQQNVTLVLDAKHKVQALNSLSAKLFNVNTESYVA